MPPGNADAEQRAQLVSPDLAYYRITEGRGERGLEAHRTLVEIEGTRMVIRLTVVLILLGSFVGIGAALDPETPPSMLIHLGAWLKGLLGPWAHRWPRLDWPDARLLLSAGVGTAFAALYWLFSGRKAR